MSKSRLKTSVISSLWSTTTSGLSRRKVKRGLEVSSFVLSSINLSNSLLFSFATRILLMVAYLTMRHMGVSEEAAKSKPSSFRDLFWRFRGRIRGRRAYGCMWYRRCALRHKHFLLAINRLIVLTPVDKRIPPCCKETINFMHPDAIHHDFTRTSRLLLQPIDID